MLSVRCVTHRCFCNPLRICIRFWREVKKIPRREERPSSCLSMRNSAINPQVFPSSSQFFRGYDFLLRVYVANGKLSLKTLTNTIHTTEFWSFVIYKIASPNTPIYGVHFCCNEIFESSFCRKTGMRRYKVYSYPHGNIRVSMAAAWLEWTPILM